MPDSMAFFDTSAIVPLCVSQSESMRARQAYKSFARPVVAWTTSIEVAGAIYRAVRADALSEAGARRALSRLTQLEARWIEMVAGDRLRHEAINALASHDLRAGDSIQLASALIWCKNRPRNRSFICFDTRLAAAARAAGFTTIGFK